MNGVKGFRAREAAAIRRYRAHGLASKEVRAARAQLLPGSSFHGSADEPETETPVIEETNTPPDAAEDAAPEVTETPPEITETPEGEGDSDGADGEGDAETESPEGEGEGEADPTETPADAEVDGAESASDAAPKQGKGKNKNKNRDRS